MNDHNQPIAPRGQVRPLPLGELDPFNVASGLDGGAEPPKQGSGISLAALLRFKWTIIVTFLVLSAVAIPAIWLKVAPEYRAVAQVRVRPIIRSLVFQTADSGLIPLYQFYLNTQVTVMGSHTVLQRVLNQSDVHQTAFYQGLTAEGPVDAGLLTEILKNSLEIVPQPRSEIIELALTLPDPHDAATIVNAVLDQYLNYIQDSSEQTDDQEYRQLKKHVETLSKEIEKREAEADTLRKELGTGDADELVVQKRVRLDEMTATLNELQKSIALAEWQKKQLQSLVASPGDASGTSTTRPSDQQRYQDDAEWRRLHNEVTALRNQMVARKARLGDQHPVMAEGRELLRLAEAAQREREKQLDSAKTILALRSNTTEVGTNPAAELHVLTRQIDKMRYEEQLHQKQLDKERTDLNRLFECARALAKENESIERSREIYKAVRKRFDQKTIERNAAGSIEVLARAFVPPLANAGRRVKMSIAVLFGSLLAGVCLALIRARTSPAFHEASDLPRVSAVPFLGVLPYVRDAEGLRTGDCPILVERVRQLRTILLQRLDPQGGSVVLITGAGPGCGKTTVARTLAKSLAQCGKSVLLVDTDFRKPSLSEHFGVGHEPGLIASLSDELPDAEAIVPTDTPGLSVLPAGVSAEGIATELLANGVFEESLDRWRGQYDAILLDTAPVLSVADAAILSRYADGTIMVVREGRCRRAEVADAFRNLVFSGASLLGTIFIGSDRRRGYGGYGGYGGYAYPAGGPSAGRETV